MTLLGLLIIAAATWMIAYLGHPELVIPLWLLVAGILCLREK
jgi:hypothetical protein